MTDPRAQGRAASYGDPARWGARLVRVVEEQLELCKQLEGLSERQTELVATDDTDALLEILSSRHVLLERIGVLGQEIEPFRAKWEELRSELHEPDRVRLERGIDAISTIVERIQQQDERDREVLTRRRSEVVTELGENVRARGAMRAYGRQDDTRGPMFQDRRG